MMTTIVLLGLSIYLFQYISNCINIEASLFICCVYK